MNMGFDGNYVTLSDPPHFKWTAEADIYYYYLASEVARKALFRQVQDQRVSSWDGVWIHHDLILFPFIINPGTSDERLQELLRERLRFRLKSPESKLFTIPWRFRLPAPVPSPTSTAL